MTRSTALSRWLGRFDRPIREFTWRHLPKLARRTTVDTRQGRFSVYTADQVIGRHLYMHGEFESQWVDAALGFLRSAGALPARGSGTVIDIGANLGVISIGMLRAGEFARAVAIEPDPDNFALLRRNVRLNRLEDRFACVHAAATDRTGEAEFELSQDNFGDHRVRTAEAPNAAAVSAVGAAAVESYQESTRRTIRVPADTVDRLLDRTPDAFARDVALVWIDTQGHEGQLFLGGERLFARDVPVVCEIWPYGLRRAGQTKEHFCRIVRERWSRFWLPDTDQKMTDRPTSELPSLFDQLVGESFCNVILTK